MMWLQEGPLETRDLSADGRIGKPIYFVRKFRGFDGNEKADRLSIVGT